MGSLNMVIERLNDLDYENSDAKVRVQGWINQLSALKPYAGLPPTETDPEKAKAAAQQRIPYVKQLSDLLAAMVRDLPAVLKMTNEWGQDDYEATRAIDAAARRYNQTYQNLVKQFPPTKQAPKQETTTKPSEQVAGKETDVDKYAKALAQKWGRVFRRRDVGGYKRYIKWRMNNKGMSAKEAFDDLNRLWTTNYGRKSRQQAGKKPAEEAKPTEQKPATTEEAKPTEPAKPKETREQKDEKYWREQLAAKGGTISDRALASMKADLFGDATGVSLGRQPVGFRRAIEQFFNLEVGRLTKQYEEQAMKDIKRNEDPFALASDYIKDNLRQRMARAGLKGSNSIEQFVNNWNTYRWDYGSYKGIQQPRKVVDNQGRTRDQYFERRPS